jgi:osomolarity two-component system response regulator SSK1
MSFSALHEASQPFQGQDEATSAAGSPKIPASPTRDESSTPGRRSPLESPGNESGPSKKTIGKRHEKQDSIGKGAGKKGKATTSSDGNIVPPISVLIVDGLLPLGFGWKEEVLI